MRKNLTRLAGVIPVVQLPYHEDGAIDWATLRKEVDWVFGQGADGVAAAMVTEILRLTEAERDALAERLSEMANGRGPVVMSAGGESTAQAVRHARAAEKAGVDALMLIPPVSVAALPEEIVDYYETVLGETELPVVVQDASGYVGRPLPVELMAGIYRRHPERVCFKPEAPPLGQSLSLLRAAVGPDAPIFEGSGGIGLVDAYPRGIAGTMPGAEIVWAIRKLWDALKEGRQTEVRRIDGAVCPLVALQTGLDGFLAVEKLLLEKQGIFRNRLVRGPRSFILDPETEAEALSLFAYLQETCMGKA